MSSVLFILLILGILGLASGVIFGGVLQKLVNTRKDCPLCWESIPAKATICPKCKARL